DYHSLQHSNSSISPDAEFKNSIFKTQPFEGVSNIFISIPSSAYRRHPQWFYNFNYSIEKYRGLDFTEDLFNHGTFTITLNAGDRLGIIISIENPENKNAFDLFEMEMIRKQSIIKDENNEVIKRLLLAADQFIVKRDKDLKTIIAGYHWFTDWGRDTMISLPGLCLSTGRFQDAKVIITTFAKNVSLGMIPNRFPDNDVPAEYNNVDGTLWYFITIKKYFDATGDTKFVLNEILPILEEIIDWHFKGTRYNIHVDEDGLLYAGERGQQLTWMDARIGDWVVTPRDGKPVEIEALWYNALNIFAELLELNGQHKDAALVYMTAGNAKRSFNKKFWFDKGKYLYDVIDKNNIPDATLRPNQLFAISLPFPLVEGERAKSILKIVREKLFTKVGLRSL
ncbi:MAG: amylo-alpha-1,6-glucosidase, partial [Chitinophagaceae bacterium]